MKLIISPELKSLGICGPAACLITEIAVSKNSPQLDEQVKELEARLKAEAGLILSMPEAAWSAKLFVRLGYPNQVPAGYRLVQGIINRGFKRINNLVDSYNIVSARHVCGIGMHDAENISTDVHVFRSNGYETIIPLFKNSMISIPKDDLIYGFRSESGEHWDVLACLGRRDVDSNNFKVTQQTRSVLVVVLGNEATTAEHNRSICIEIHELILRTNPAAKIKFMDVFHSL